MKRKVAKGARLRLSPNEEALLLKEEHERRRKLRLQQVREQERNIALQIRQDIKQRRDEQLRQLAEELKAEWQKAQDEKIKALEKLYLSSLRTIGEGHRQAKEHEPDLMSLAKQAAERKQRAEKRHKEALKKQRNQKEKLQRDQTWRLNARKHALDTEKERAAKIASLPPPSPHPFEFMELKNVPTAKVYEDDCFSQTHHHLFDPYVDKEMDVEQPDARLLAEEEVKRQEKLQIEEERDRREQLEKAHLRGKHALKMVRLARDREKLMQELEQMQNQDLARRKRTVAQMPLQLFVPPYRRMEIKEEWQRDLECAFEDMYTGDRKMKGDLILHLDPQPLPAFSDHSQDDELELSQEPDSVCEVPTKLGDEVKDREPGGSEVEKALTTHSKLPLTKLLNKIRNQKNHWTSRCKAETPSEIGTIESGTLSSRERKYCESESEHEPNRDSVSEVKDLPEVLDPTVLAGNVVLSHPQEQVTEIRKNAKRQSQLEWLEQQKQQQLALLRQIEEQKIQLEVDFLKARLQHQEEEAKKEQEKRAQQSQVPQMNVTCPAVQQEVEHQFETATETEVASSSREDDHIQMIRDYQQRLLIQNRIHKESVDEARRRLLEYQNKLKQRYPSTSAGLLNHTTKPAQWNSVPESPLQSQGFAVWQRGNLSLYQPSKNASVQEFTESVEGLLNEPSGQKNKEQMVDVVSGKQVQPMCSQIERTSSQLSQTSCQQTKKLATPVTQSSLEFQDISASFMIKSQDSSVVSQPVAHKQQVPFTLPADNSSESSEALWPDKLESYASLEKYLPPTSMFKQHLPTESRTRTSDPAGLPHFQPLYSLPTSVNGETRGTQESMVIKNGSFSHSDIMELRNKMLASSKSIQAQQEHLKELQEQLDEQREALLSRQRIQEKLLMQKHTQLKQQMEQQQEALKDILKQAGQSSTCRETTQEQETESFNLILSKEANGSSQEEVHFSEASSLAENNLVQSFGSAEQIEPFQKPWGKEEKWRTSKPPLTKVKLGLDLEQHELSVIPELDTPRSGRLSAPGYMDSFAGDTFLTSDVGELQSSKHLTDSPLEDLAVVGIAPDAKEQSSSESLISQLSESCENLVMDAGGLGEEVQLKDPPSMVQHLRSSSMDLGRRMAMDYDSSFRPNSMAALAAPESPASLSPSASNQEAACSYLSSFTISTDSFISIDHPGRSFTSTGMWLARDHPSHIGSPTKEKASCTWDSSVSQLSKQDDPSEAPDSSPSFGEKLQSNRSKFQQLIDKYTRDLSWSSLSNISSQDPSVGLHGTGTEQNFPNFHRELSQSLEQNLGFDIISPLSQSRIFHDSRDPSKSSDLSKSHELSSRSSDGRSRLTFLNTENLSNPLQIRKTTREQIQDAEDFFQPLPVESVLSELNQSADVPGNFSTVFEQNFETRASVESNTRISPETLEHRPLERGEANISTHSPIEHFRSLSPIEDQGSFYQLLPDYGAIKNALEIRCSVKENMASEENLCFVELPVASADQKYEMVTENVTISDDLELDLSQCTLHTVEEQSFLAIDTTCLPQEMKSEVPLHPGKNSGQQNDCVPDTLQQPHLNSMQAKSSVLHVSQSKIPVWETQSGQGIMEEPELTLISSNDISTVESDLELFSQGDGNKEKTENLLYRDHSEIKCYPKQSGELLPLQLEVDDDASTEPDNYPSIAQCPKERSLFQKHKSTEFTSAPESLQESFLKRKKDFIERSSKRLEKIKSRERCEQPHAKASQQEKKELYSLKENLPPPGLPVDVKKMEEVKVHFADDRKIAEKQMYQRTSRLYNNLSEVKVRKKEKERQETYTRNREKAKEFQKKTLEKLRAKKAH